MLPLSFYLKVTENPVFISSFRTKISTVHTHTQTWTTARVVTRNELFKSAMHGYTIYAARARERDHSIGRFRHRQCGSAVIHYFIVPKWLRSVISRRNQTGRYIGIDNVLCVRAYLLACLPAYLPVCLPTSPPACMPPACELCVSRYT